MLANEQILLKERIRHLLHIKKCTISSLSENETERVRISRQINGDANVTIDTIRLILFSFPNVSADWLILGDSKTDRSNKSAPPMPSNKSYSSFIPSIDDAIAQRDVLINTLRAQIDQLTRDKELLHGLLESLTIPAKSNSKTTKNR